MKKNQLFALALGVVLSLSLAACGTTAQKDDSTLEDFPTISPAPDSVDENGSVQIPDPWKEASSLEEAEELAGFSIVVPEEVNGCARSFQVMTGEDPCLEAYYYTAGDESRTYIRKAPGTDDISGDYNVYTQTKIMTTEDGREVTLQGTEDVFYLATWTSDEYTYAIGVPEGLSDTDLLALAADVQ